MRLFLLGLCAVSGLGGTAILAGEAVPLPPLQFTPLHNTSFESPGSQSVAWADYDRDGDLDFVVGYRGAPLRFYKQDAGSFKLSFEQTSAERDVSDYRSLSWGDFNKDGFPDLYVGFGRDAGRRNLLLVGSASGFSEQAGPLGVDALGTSRQSSWVDYDQDGDSDLFIAMRDRTSRLLRNDGDSFANVSGESGLNDPRRSVGAVWFDFDRDGDLDLYLPNQSGDRDGLYRNDGLNFVDIAQELEIDRPRRPLREGSVGATLCDVNNDGHFDVFVPVYGADLLYIADGQGGFSEQAKQWGVNDAALAVSADCGDLNNDGKMDLYVVAYERGKAHGHDRLYLNQGDHFVDFFPQALWEFDADHGVRFADFDDDGDLDLASTNRHQNGRLNIWRNELQASDERHWIKVEPLDANGRFTLQGSEVRAFEPGTDQLIAAGLVDTGGGYISQNMQPVHLGLGSISRLDIEITSLHREGRCVTRIGGVDANQTLSVKIKPDESCFKGAS